MSPSLLPASSRLTPLTPLSDPGSPDPVASSPQAPARWWRSPDAVEALSAAVLLAAAWGSQAAGAPPSLWVVLYLACYACGGWRATAEGLTALRHGRLEVDLLMVVAAGAAAAIGQWRDGGLLIVIFATSGALETLALSRTEAGVRALMDLQPAEAVRRRPDGSEERIPAAEVAAGDQLVVRPGERLAVDAVVTSGRSDVDESSLTGEPVPVPKEVGENVLGGSLNGTGLLVVRAERAAAASAAARVAALVADARQSSAPTQLAIERVEQRYAVALVVATVALVAVPLALGSAFEPTLLRAMTFMIVASPCALVLATMPALLSAMAAASRTGVLVKGGVAMERLASTTVVALDKTGTLTVGRPKVVAVTAVGMAEENLLALVAAAERGSEHPLGAAVVAAGEERGVEVLPVEEFRALPGQGVEAMVGARLVRAGAPRWLDSADPPAPLADALAEASQHGRAVLAVEVDGVLAGVLALADTVRPEARQAVRALRDLGVHRVVLLTGDTPAAAAAAAARVGIHDVRAGLMPADKVAAVRELRAAGERVLFVGDGINDAPALAAADLGIAIGGGADLALETADVALVRPRLDLVPEVIALSQRANRLVRQNLALAGSVIVVLVCLDLAGRLSLPAGVVVHEGSTILVALNGLRMLRRPLSGRGAGGDQGGGVEDRATAQGGVGDAGQQA